MWHLKFRARLKGSYCERFVVCAHHLSPEKEIIVPACRGLHNISKAALAESSPGWLLRSAPRAQLIWRRDTSDKIEMFAGLTEGIFVIILGKSWKPGNKIKKPESFEVQHFSVPSCSFYTQCNKMSLNCLHYSLMFAGIITLSGQY